MTKLTLNVEKNPKSLITGYIIVCILQFQESIMMLLFDRIVTFETRHEKSCFNKGAGQPAHAPPQSDQSLVVHRFNA